MSVTLAPAESPEEARERLLELERVLNIEFVDRRQVIRTAVHALVAQCHHFQLGSPGTAKSLLVRRTALRIGGLTEGSFFQWLLTPFTDPNELYGPPDLLAIKEGRYQRITKGKMPEATIVFLDETFKGSSAILNANLTMLNERLFFNGSEPVPVPLRVLFGASNELADGEGLSALYDRLHFRHHLKPLTSSSDFIRMLNMVHDDVPDQIIHIDDIDLASSEAKKVILNDETLEAIRNLRDDLRSEGIEPTERRFRETLKIIRATAWLHGRIEAEVEDMALLQHVLWDRPEHAPKVANSVLKLANPLDQKALMLLEEIEQIYQDMDKVIQTGDSPNAVARQSVDFFHKLGEAKKEVNTLIAEFKKANRKSQHLMDLVTRYREVALVLEQKCFQVPEMAGLEKLNDDEVT